MPFDYSAHYKELDLRKNPERYQVGKGEQGVLMVEPYKSEILPYWKFRTESIARQSAKDILGLFYTYRESKEFVGMDMARKFLQMGYTRARRYANHKSGHKYDSKNGDVLPQELDWETNEKAKAASVFFTAWKQAEADPEYQVARKQHKELYG